MNKSTILETNKEGTKYWYLNGKLHREDGPAIIHKDGTKEWYLNDKRHRIDGPAIEYHNGNKSGSKIWFLYGQIHCEYGPAIIWVDGTKAWYLNDICLTKEEWFQQLSLTQQYNYLWNLNE